MPTGISRVCRNIAPSATLAMDAKAKALKADGVKVYSFAAGEPDFDTPLAIRDATKQALDLGMTRYTPVPGTLELRDAIIEKLQRDNGLSYTRDEVIVSCGAKHSLYTAFQTILCEGDEVIIPTPCWVSYPEIVRMAGGVPVFVETTEENNFVPDVESIRAAVTDKTKAFILTTPSNPCGCVWSEKSLRQLAQLCEEKDFYIVSDEIYENLIYDERKHYSIASMTKGAKERTLVVNGVSKSYAMTGYRIGYVAGPKDVIKAMTNYQSQASSAPNSAAQYAAAYALRMDQGCVEDMRVAFEQRRNAIYDRINAIQGVHCRKPEGAFYVMMNVSSLIGKYYGEHQIESATDLANLLLENKHVVVVPGEAFMAKGYCRLSYATDMQTILNGTSLIAEFVTELNQGRSEQIA